MPAPADEYRRRLEARHETHARLTHVDVRYSAARLAVFALGALVAFASWRGWISPWSLLVPALTFAILVVRHDRVLRALDAAVRAIGFYERGLARIEDRWAGAAGAGERFRNLAHLYAQDLDLFGPGSLFELLSTARTRAGEDTLAAWLLTPASVPDISARQHATDDLSGRLDLREGLSLAGSDIRASVHTDDVIAWAEGPPVLGSRWLRPVAAMLSIASIASASFAAATGLSGPFIVVVMVIAGFSVPLTKRTAKALHGADRPAHDLDVLAVVLARLEQEPFQAERLTTLQGQLGTAGTRASTAIRRLHRLVELHDWQHNLVFAPIAAAVLWGTHLALAIEAWRREHGNHVREWLRIAGEFEAIASLSAYRYEHPDDPFPDVIEATSHHGIYEGAGLGHPLIPSSRIVRNDVALGDTAQLLVVSGSNMSGKSTLLRTVGINAVLAFAGAPVRARSLRLTRMRIGATLRIQDSLQEGRSRFYAEISRVREIADLASRTDPVLFLLDELFHGTNSHDRVVGASGVLRALLDRDAIGLITTHDLALTTVAAELAPRASNVHFDDRFEAGEILFDYVMKPGPVTRSNALALMRAVGLLDRTAPQD